MNDTKPESAVEQPAKVDPQTAEPKPVKVTAPKTPKIAKAPKAKPSKVKAATGKSKTAKAPAKAKKPAKANGKSKAAKQTAKPQKAKAAKPTKQGKAITQGKFPRHKANPFRPGSAYGAIFDAFVLRKAGIRRDELLKLAMEATGKDVKHAAYDLAVIRSAKDSNTGPRHPSCAEGFWVKRDNDCFTLMID